jgi:hypothetical protein
VQHDEQGRREAGEGQQGHFDAQQRQLDWASQQELQVGCGADRDCWIDADGQERDPERDRLPAGLVDAFSRSGVGSGAGIPVLASAYFTKSSVSQPSVSPVRARAWTACRVRIVLLRSGHRDPQPGR